MSSGRLVLLSLLDLSAACDTVDQRILRQRMSTSFGITGKSLQWFDSYLKDRTQSVFLSGDMTPRKLTTGVPQGSVLGPLLFTLYTTLTTINFTHHVFRRTEIFKVENYFVHRKCRSVNDVEPIKTKPLEVGILVVRDGSPFTSC